MPTISITRPHSLSHKAAKDAAQRVVEDLRRRFDLDYAWDGDEVAFDRPGVSGRMFVGRDAVALEVKLGLLLGALKSTVEREIHQQLDALFAAPANAPARKSKPVATAKPAAAKTGGRRLPPYRRPPRRSRPDRSPSRRSLPPRDRQAASRRRAATAEPRDASLASAHAAAFRRGEHARSDPGTDRCGRR